MTCKINTTEHLTRK